jgi:hypothetical protein
MTGLSPAGKIQALEIEALEFQALELRVTIGLGSRPIGSMAVGLAGGPSVPGER